MQYEDIGKMSVQEVSEYVAGIRIKSAVEFLLWCFDNRPELVHSIYDTIAKRYMPIIIRVSNGRYVSLIDYGNPRFDAGVEGTCHISVYHLETGACTERRLVYKLGLKMNLFQLVENSIDFMELPLEGMQILGGLGTQLFVLDDSEDAVSSKIF